MKKSIVLATALSVMLLGTPAMAEEAGAKFYALSQLSPGLTAMPEGQLAAIEGGEELTLPLIPGNVHSFVLCSTSPSGLCVGLIADLPVVVNAVSALLGALGL